MQTKAVRGVVDAVRPHEEGTSSASDANIDEESREEDDHYTPEIRPLGDVAKWYEDSATAAETQPVDGIVELQEEYDAYALGTMAASPQDDPCRSGMVGRIRAQGSECFDACPQMCEPLAEAITAFLRRGGAPALRRVVCRRKESFYCPLQEVNRARCEPFITRARRMRITLPNSIPALQEECRR